MYCFKNVQGFPTQGCQVEWCNEKAPALSSGDWKFEPDDATALSGQEPELSMLSGW